MVAPVLIHFRLGFSMKSSTWGTFRKPPYIDMWENCSVFLCFPVELCSVMFYTCLKLNALGWGITTWGYSWYRNRGLDQFGSGFGEQGFQKYTVAWIWGDDLDELPLVEIQNRFREYLANPSVPDEWRMLHMQIAWRRVTALWPMVHN